MDKTWQEICFSRDRIKLQNKMIDKDIWQSCKNCLYFNRRDNFCKKFNANPPIETIIVGCENWESQIPF